MHFAGILFRIPSETPANIENTVGSFWGPGVGRLVFLHPVHWCIPCVLPSRGSDPSMLPSFLCGPSTCRFRGCKLHGSTPRLAPIFVHCSKIPGPNPDVSHLTGPVTFCPSLVSCILEATLRKRSILKNWVNWKPYQGTITNPLECL